LKAHVGRKQVYKPGTPALVLRSSQMIQLVRVRAAREAVLSRSAMNHPFASEH